MKKHLARYFPKAANLVAVGLSILPYACGGHGQIQPVPDFARGFVGQPLERYKAIERRDRSYVGTGWEEKTDELPNGNWVYVAPVARDCIIHWEVNRAGTIVGYKLEGSRCD